MSYAPLTECFLSTKFGIDISCETNTVLSVKLCC